MVGLLLAAIAAVAVASLLWSANKSDRLAVSHQSELVAQLLSDRIVGIAYDQESVAIWDDTIENTVIAFDREWIDSNIGTWMYDYFGHDQTFILNEYDEPIYGMVDGEDFGTETFAALGADAQRVVDLTRSKIARGDVELFNEGAADNPRSVDVGVVDGRPAIVSAMAIVSDSGDLIQTDSNQYVLLSVRFLDGSFLGELTDHYLIQNIRFAWNDDAVGPDESTPVLSDSGEAAGFIIWQPDRPGARLLAETGPVLAVALLLLSLITVTLSRRLKRTYDQIKKSEAQALHRAGHDQLTGLPNRFEFLGTLEHAVESFADPLLPLAVLIVDLDGFKNVNDALGHPAGDEVIRCPSSEFLGQMAA